MLPSVIGRSVAAVCSEKAPLSNQSQWRTDETLDRRLQKKKLENPLEWAKGARIASKEFWGL
jgi:hypothetical protein